MRITVEFSSLFRAISGVEREDMEVEEGMTIKGLSGILGQKYPDLPLESEKAYFVVNNQIVALDQILEQGDKVRIFQLLAGG